MRAAIASLILLLPLLAAAADDPRAQKVDEIFAAYNHPNSPGCSIGVIRDGKLVYRKSYGKASLELGVPLADDSVFYMASVSKQFTAAAVVLAAEQGHLSLDDDVRKYVPELPDYGHPITLRQLLHHTSGLRDFLSLTYLSGHDIGELSSPDEILRVISRQKGLNNDPGAEFIYSNSNYFLAGVVVQRATGKSLAEFAAQNIFQPLGMSHTRFYDDNRVIVPGRVAAYDQDKDGKFAVDWSTSYDIVGGGGLLSTVADLERWDENFYQNRLGKGTLTRELQTRGLLNNGKPINYGLGLWLGTYRGLATVEHSGGTFGYRTELLRFPARRFSVIALCNVQSANVERLSRKVADLYLSGQEYSRRRPPSLPAITSTIPHLTPEPMLIRTITWFTHSRLRTASCRHGARYSSASSPNQFYDLVGNPITFEARNGGMTARLDLEGETYFSGPRVPEPHLSVEDLRQFVGHTAARIGCGLCLAIGWRPAAIAGSQSTVNYAEGHRREGFYCRRFWSGDLQRRSQTSSHRADIVLAGGTRHRIRPKPSETGAAMTVIVPSAYEWFRLVHRLEQGIFRLFDAPVWTSLPRPGTRGITPATPTVFYSFVPAALTPWAGTAHHAQPTKLREPGPFQGHPWDSRIQVA